MLYLATPFFATHAAPFGVHLFKTAWFELNYYTNLALGILTRALRICLMELQFKKECLFRQKTMVFYSFAPAIALPITLHHDSCYTGHSSCVIYLADIATTTHGTLGNDLLLHVINKILKKDIAPKSLYKMLS